MRCCCTLKGTGQRQLTGLEGATDHKASRCPFLYRRAQRRISGMLSLQGAEKDGQRPQYALGSERGQLWQRQYRKEHRVQ